MNGYVLGGKDGWAKVLGCWLRWWSITSYLLKVGSYNLYASKILSCYNLKKLFQQ